MTTAVKTPLAATNKQHTGIMVAFILKPVVAKKLAIPGGEPPSDMHLTLTFHGDAEELTSNQLDELTQAVLHYSKHAVPLRGTVSGVGRFNPSPSSDGKAPVIALVNVPGIQQWREELAQALAQVGFPPDDTFAYTPHITLDYIDEDAEMPVKSVPKVALEFDAVTLAIGDKHYTYSLEGKQQLAETPTSPAGADLRRITEADPDYQELHQKTIAQLGNSLRQYIREEQFGDQAADSRFYQRHVELMRQAYLTAHREGQKDYWPAVSNRTVQHRFVQPPKDDVQRRMSYFAIGSALKLKNDVKLYLRTGQTRPGASSVSTATLETYFGHSIELADLPGDFSNRVAMQGQIVWSGLQDGYSDAGANDSATPYSELYWNLGPVLTEHCSQCPDIAMGSPYDPPWAGAGSNQLNQTPGDGQTDCGAACKCSLSYSAPQGEALAELGKAITAKWNDWLPTGYDAAGDVTTQQITPPAAGSALTDAQKAALDDFRNSSDMWDTVRRNLPPMPSFFGTEDLPSPLPPWDQLTPEQQAVVKRVEQSWEQWGNATARLVPPPVFLPDPAEVMRAWGAAAARGEFTPWWNDYVEPPSESQINQEWVNWLTTLEWPDPHLPDPHAELEAWTAWVQEHYDELKAEAKLDTDFRGSEPMEQPTIQLYNPYHGPDGRFTTGGSAHTRVERGQGRTRRGEGGRRVRNETHQASSSGGDDRLSRLAQAQSDLAATQQRANRAERARDRAGQKQIAAEGKYRTESYRLQGIERGLQEQAQDQIIESRAARAPKTYERYQTAKADSERLESERQQMQQDIDYYGSSGPHSVQREIQAEAMTQSDYASNHNYRAYQRALQSSPRYDEYQRAGDQIKAYEDLSSRTYRAQFDMNRYKDQLIGDRATNSDLIYQHPDYLAQKSIVDEAKSALDDANTAFSVADNEFNSAVGARNQLQNTIERLSRTTENGVTFTNDDARASIEDVFGRQLSTDEIKDLAGGRPDDYVTISTYGRGSFGVRLESEDGTRTGDFTVQKHGGQIEVSVGTVRNSEESSTGVARDITDSLETMRSLGVTKLYASAARAEGGHERGYNGYYTWARLGFTGSIPSNILSAAQAEFGPSTTRVEQIMQQGARGRNWWKANGTTFQATFDFTDGSYSMNTLNGWRAAVNRNS